MLDQFRVSDDVAVFVDHQAMRATVEDIFVALGMPSDDARQSADVLLYADVRATVRYWQRRLPTLAATPTLVHIEVVADAIKVLQRLKQVPCQHHRPDSFLNLTVTNHVSLTRRECEHLVLGHTAIPVPNVHAIVDTL